MRNKIILGLAVLIFLFTNASAQFVQGNNITQAQLDSVNIDNATWQTLSCRNESSLAFNNGFYVIGASCLTLKNNNDGTYLVDRHLFYAFFRVIDYWTCRVTNTQSYCNTKYIGILYGFADREVQKEKNLAKSYQTPVNNALPQALQGVNIFH